MTIPKINRRGWLAKWLQKRRRHRAPAILLKSDGHGRLTWTINFIPPGDDSQPGVPYDSINIYTSADGVTWGVDNFDSSDLGSGSWDGSGFVGYFRICICDWTGLRRAALLERRSFRRLVIIMALTLIKEDGTGKVDANSYADLADGNAYHDGPSLRLGVDGGDGCSKGRRAGDGDAAD